MSGADEERAAAPAITEPEELARANLYGLVSRLFYGPPDPDLLAEVADSPIAEEGGDGGDWLVAAWRSLREACGNTCAGLVRQEYEGLFIGVGKALVTPYLSAYAEPSSPDRYLVRLRDRLAALGLARRTSVFETEDHISGACDVMRFLIENGRPLAEQCEYFESFVYPGAPAFCCAVQEAPGAAYYQHVAKFSLTFFQLEKAAFEMGE